MARFPEQKPIRLKQSDPRILLKSVNPDRNIDCKEWLTLLRTLAKSKLAAKTRGLIAVTKQLGKGGLDLGTEQASLVALFLIVGFVFLLHWPDQQTAVKKLVEIAPIRQ